MRETTETCAPLVVEANNGAISTSFDTSEQIRRERIDIPKWSEKGIPSTSVRSRSNALNPLVDLDRNPVVFVASCATGSSFAQNEAPALAFGYRSIMCRAPAPEPNQYGFRVN